MVNFILIVLNLFIECNPTTGRELNVMKAKAYFTSSGIVLNNNVYFGSTDNNVYEYNTETKQQTNSN